MKGLLLALLLGAVLQSWGQKFPGMVGPLPKLSKELPNAVICPILPTWFDRTPPIDRVFANLDEFLDMIWEEHCCAGFSLTWLPDRVREQCGSPVHIKAKNLTEACCQAAWAWPCTWHTRTTPYVWIAVITDDTPAKNTAR